jgi:hypothetical protein
MRIISYTSTDAPQALAACARIQSQGQLHPVVFHAPSEEEVRAKAQAWWDAELAKQTKRMPKRTAKPAVPDVGDVI